MRRTPRSSEMPRTGLSDFYPVSTMQKSLVIDIGDATRKIRGNPSRPVRLFWCNEQPSCLIFQKRDAALTSPSLCGAQPRRWRLNARLVGLSCSPAARFLPPHMQVWMHMDTHTRVYNCPPQFSSETVFFPVGSSLPISVSECTDIQPFTSQAGKSAQPHFHGAHVAP